MKIPRLIKVHFLKERSKNLSVARNLPRENSTFLHMGQYSENFVQLLNLSSFLIIIVKDSFKFVINFNWSAKHIQGGPFKLTSSLLIVCSYELVNLNGPPCKLLRFKKNN